LEMVDIRSNEVVFLCNVRLLEEIARPMQDLVGERGYWMPDRFGEKQDQTNTILGEGQAALWLTESLILALLEANLLNTDTILEAIDTVIAAKRAKAAEGSERDVSRAAITHL